MIKYTKIDKPSFKTKKLASKWVEEIGGSKFDRTQIKKSGDAFYVWYYTFPKEVKAKVNAIVFRSKHTSKIYNYNEVATKPLSWIESTYKRLMKLSL